MIAMVRGEVAIRRSDHVVVLCGGVGYRMAVSTETLRHVPPVGGETTLHTHLVVRDDALLLHGFHSEQERDLFLMLVSVQAVGPKVAVAVLSSGPPRELLASIAGADAARFQAVPGIGKRTAERIIVELREKVGVDVEVESPGVGGHASGPRALAHEGLVALGYNALEADGLLRDLDGDSPEELIAGALRTARRAA
ncbi:MAG TPA: Holliday junction branch migration protein RuvA [Solirubrobacteraceae bacterium]|jgi:Holliday junction DNA helicase RuvA|nr:Holliday junction branch migration protein RuvA [Solirubrobacteraceae bacterium]